LSAVNPAPVDVNLKNTFLFFLTTSGAGSILLEVFVEIMDFHGLDSRFLPLLVIPQQQLNRYSLPKSITGF
jgi:hypothetical protein